MRGDVIRGCYRIVGIQSDTISLDAERLHFQYTTALHDSVASSTSENVSSLI